ncbi:MAG: hypothetical protein JNN08_00845 [Bryobacterales bacterium]|nr:hypothetical protein [Bryobacterales bacterium]
MAENVFAVFKSLAEAGTAMEYLRNEISCDENLHLLGHVGGAKELLRLSPEQPSEARQPGEVLVSCAQVPEIGPVVCTGAFEPSIEIAGQLGQLGVPEEEASEYVDALRHGYSMLCVSCTKTAPDHVANILAQANPVALPEAIESDLSASSQSPLILPMAGPITGIIRFAYTGVVRFPALSREELSAPVQSAKPSSILERIRVYRGKDQPTADVPSHGR